MTCLIMSVFPTGWQSSMRAGLTMEPLAQCLAQSLHTIKIFIDHMNKSGIIISNSHFSPYLTLLNNVLQLLESPHHSRSWEVETVAEIL